MCMPVPSSGFLINYRKLSSVFSCNTVGIFATVRNVKKVRLTHDKNVVQLCTATFPQNLPTPALDKRPGGGGHRQRPRRSPPPPALPLEIHKTATSVAGNPGHDRREKTRDPRTAPRHFRPNAPHRSDPTECDVAVQLSVCVVREYKNQV